MPVEIWTLTIPASIGAMAWLYQKAWERQERRLKQYEEILDTLPGFVEGGLDIAKINTAIALGRRLWLLGPDNVVQAFEAFTSSIEQSRGHDAAELAMGELVLRMRKDVTFSSAIFPRVRTRLKSNDFRLKSAKAVASISATPSEITVQQSHHATIVANGALLIALQTAMKSAILDAKLQEADLVTLTSRISSDVTNAPASGFGSQDVLEGKKQALTFVGAISEAIKREIASKQS